MSNKFRTRNDPGHSSFGDHYPVSGPTESAYGARARASGVAQIPQERSVDSMKAPVETGWHHDRRKRWFKVDALVHREADGSMVVHPGVPVAEDGIAVRRRLMAHEKVYWSLIDENYGEEFAREEAERVELTGLNHDEIVRYEAILDNIGFPGPGKSR